MNRLEQLRKKWLYYKKLGDMVMCGVIERQAKALKMKNSADETEILVKKHLL